MGNESKGWLSISTEGFASMNAARPPEHLIKELLQNSLDSISIDSSGRIELNYEVKDGAFLVECRDNGAGIENLSDLRVVYLTNKTDSHLKRGRFGRGFKEALCIASSAEVTSGHRKIQFLYENDERITREISIASFHKGTLVTMKMPWSKEVKGQLDKYFRQFLIPENVELLVNGELISSRVSDQCVETSLPTEIYDFQTQSWKKPKRKTLIRLVQVKDEESPTIYEMGIPVADVEWKLPFHCDVQQRVPMNPNRDAVASGYPLKLHIACLPNLVLNMDSEAVQEDWVGTAANKCDEPVQKLILEKAFGSNIARSVPKMGSRQFDEDARELGVQIINTAQTSGGFRDMLKKHVPTAKDVVQQDEHLKAEQAAASGFNPSEVKDEEDARNAWIKRQGGHERVEECLDFAVWFCQKLVDSTPISLRPVTGKIALNTDKSKAFCAHWSDSNVLTLALDEDCFWRDPFSPESLEILIHEAAHAMNMHHGADFRREVERLAGIATNLMFIHSKALQERYIKLIPGKDKVHWTTKIKSLLERPANENSNQKEDKGNSLKDQCQDQNSENQDSITSIFSRQNIEGVTGSNFQWSEGSHFLSEGKYTFSIRNDLQESVRNITCLIVFFDRSGNTLEMGKVIFHDSIPGGLARRAKGKVDRSIQQLTTPDRSQIPSTCVEIRILSFQPEKVITNCPNCAQKLRTPSNLGKLNLTCPKCSHSWTWLPE